MSLFDKRGLPPLPAPLPAPLDPSEAIRRYEARKLNEHGFHWPVARHFMRHAQNIRARMVEDLQIASLREYPALTTLANRGWSLAQVTEHGQRALDAFFSRPA